MARDLDTSLLRIFLTCVTCGSISRAAQLLGRSQPTISEQLRRLEDVVGAPLLVRSHEGVALTPRGERLVPYARRLLQLSAEALDGVAGDGRVGGHVGLGLMDDLTLGRFPDMLKTIRDAHPAMSMEMVSLPAAEMRQALDSGRVQIVMGDVAHLDIEPVRIWSERFVWVGSAGFDPGDGPLPVVTCSQPCRFRQRILAALNDAGVPWRVAFESTTLSGLHAAVLAGLGTAALLGRFVPRGLEPIPPVAGLAELPALDLALVRRPGSEGDRLVDAVADGLMALMAPPRDHPIEPGNRALVEA